jgi:hypothetical protein
MKTFRITTERENAKNINQVQLEKNIINSLNADDCETNIENLQQLEDEILINKALGLINLRMCQEGGIAFDKLAQAINRQRNN